MSLGSGVVQAAYETARRATVDLLPTDTYELSGIARAAHGAASVRVAA